MINFIENLRAKPEHVRKRFAFITSFSFTMIIFLGWIFSYSFSPSSVVADGKKIDTPASSITATAINAFNDLKNIVLGSNKTEYKSELEVVGGKR